MPGVFSFTSISSRIPSQVMPGRHCSCGLSVTTVSNMESGAGSVGVSDWPALPKTVSTSAICRSKRSWICRILVASPMDIPGTAVGMNRIVPSFNGGMNSFPSFWKG